MPLKSKSTLEFFGSDLQKVSQIPKFHHLSKVSHHLSKVENLFKSLCLSEFVNLGCSSYRLGRIWGHGYPECIHQTFVVINLTNPKFHIRKIGINAFKILKIIKQKIWEQGPTDYHTRILLFFITIYMQSYPELVSKKNTP